MLELLCMSVGFSSLFCIINLVILATSADEFVIEAIVLRCVACMAHSARVCFVPLICYSSWWCCCSGVTWFLLLWFACSNIQIFHSWRIINFGILVTASNVTIPFELSSLYFIYNPKCVAVDFATRYLFLRCARALCSIRLERSEKKKKNKEWGLVKLIKSDENLLFIQSSSKNRTFCHI